MPHQYLMVSAEPCENWFQLCWQNTICYLRWWM